MVRALHARDVFLLIIAVAAVGGTAPNAFAQLPAGVRTLNPTPVVRWINASKDDVLVTVGPGTTLDVLDKENDWFWIVAPADAHGTRRAGWVNERNVEAIARLVPTRSQGDAGRPLTNASATSATPGLAGAAPGFGGPVTSSSTAVTPGSTTAATASGANATVTRKEYGFDDVHFALNQFAISAEQAEILDRAAAVLKDDPLLRVNVDGYTCNLGTTAYNLVLGDRRANTVKDYLVSKGVPADRLHTASFGEQRPKYDNSHEETRRLNRRVAIVPNVQP